MDRDISIVPFRYKYLSALNSLLDTPVSMKILPKIGYLALMNGHPVAAGFLRKVEGNMAQIDTMAASSHFGSLVKGKALDIVLKSLISDAKDLNCSQVSVITRDAGAYKLAVDTGFQLVTQETLSLRLRE